MGQAPAKSQDDENEDRNAERDMKGHGSAGLLAAMDVGHQPADRILDRKQRDDQPVEHLGRGAVMWTCGHGCPRSGLKVRAMTCKIALPPAAVASSLAFWTYPGHAEKASKSSRPNQDANPQHDD